MHADVMAIEGKEADRLAEVRHRAPAIAATTLDYGILAELTGFSVKLVWLLARALTMRDLEDSGVTPQRFSMLELIGRNPGLQQTQLADALALSRPATTVIIDFWEGRGCVVRRQAPGDRRSFGVFLTASGEDELRRLRTVMRRADDALTVGLTSAELEMFNRLLKKIHG